MELKRRHRRSMAIGPPLACKGKPRTRVKVYDQELLYSGPLFTHQVSHLWVDFRGIQDAYMRGKNIDYFENSRRATYVQQQYAIRNPGQFEAYGETCWGITASEGPGCVTRNI